jgi:hypothetical protein
MEGEGDGRKMEMVREIRKEMVRKMEIVSKKEIRKKKEMVRKMEMVKRNGDKEGDSG